MRLAKIIIPLILSITTVFTNVTPLHPANEVPQNVATATDEAALEISAKAGYLIEATTGTVLYSKNPEQSCAIASVTKVMTLLLVMEAIESSTIKLEDKVMISKKAASMGGSQVYLEEGESISVEELIKCTVIASANDASVALAELVGGSESSFVKKMNEKAEQLTLVNTYFENTTGLDDTTTNHHSCASDVAVISRELIKHPLILKYSSIWQDSIRGGEMVLTNTNRLIRYYEGCNGLKTGSTDKAGFCISVTAKRQNMQLIAVVLGANTKDDRNADARTLLDFGFANFSLFESAEAYLEKAYVKNGKESYCDLYKTGFSCVVDKAKARKIEEIYEIPEHLSAPVKSGDVVGKITYQIDGEKIGEAEVYAKYDIAQINAIDVFLRLIRKIIVGA